MRRLILAIAAMALLTLSCSSGGSQAERSTISGVTVEAATAIEPLEPEQKLLGDAPTATISADLDEQSAAFAAYWSFENFDRCLSHTQVSGGSSEATSPKQFCTEKDFVATDSGASLESLVDRFDQYREEGIRSAPDPLPSEHSLLWARKSSTEDTVVGVLECQRNYYVTLNDQGDVIDDSSQTALALLRVVKGEDRQWRVDSSIGIRLAQSPTSGGDSCSAFDGTEVEESVFAEFIR